jgi:oxygen-independent coproporphyrinogen-3 oxidase
MAGIYIHYPFCTDKCPYCNFFSLASEKMKKGFDDALLKETELRRSFIDGHIIKTIYLGGGTPSLMQASTIKNLISSIKNHYQIARDVEITIEANPDNLSPEYCSSLLNAGINRMSVGVQSFQADDLKYLQRKHSGDAARQSLINLNKAGFTNISADLIFGIPSQEKDSLKKNADILMSLNVKHISAYALTVEDKTPLKYLISKNISAPTDNDIQAAHFLFVKDYLSAHGFLHYEISNYSLSGYESKHNTSYWEGEAYLGLGPSAHSYNNSKRYWNISSVKKYIEGIKNNKPAGDYEILRKKDHYNEYIMTGIRTSKGISADYIFKNFGEKYHRHLHHKLSKHLKGGHLYQNQNCIALTPSGMLHADGITADLFI